MRTVTSMLAIWPAPFGWQWSGRFRATILFVVANNSTVAEPLCDLYPRVMPSIGDKARTLTGSKAAYSNVRAKRLLGWQPIHSWRRD